MAICTINSHCKLAAGLTHVSGLNHAFSNTCWRRPCSTCVGVWRFVHRILKAKQQAWQSNSMAFLHRIITASLLSMHLQILSALHTVLLLLSQPCIASKIRCITHRILPVFPVWINVVYSNRENAKNDWASKKKFFLRCVLHRIITMHTHVGLAKTNMCLKTPYYY